MRAALEDDFLAERYGWTIQQIDDAPQGRKENMMVVARIRRQVEVEAARSDPGGA